MLESFLTIATHPLLLIFIGLTVVFYGVQGLVGRSAEAPTAPEDRLRRLAEKVGMKGLHPVLFLFVSLIFLVLSAMWVFLGVTLFLGLCTILFEVISHDASEAVENVWEWRFTLAQLVALTTVLGAVIALPITINRLILTRRQTDTVEQGHITDRINKAVEGLGAEKTVDRIGRPILFREVDPDHGSMGGVDLEERITVIEWQRESLSIPDGMYVADEGKWQAFTETQPNLEVRIGAIYALERISQDSARDHIQIMEILCAYIRQNAPANTAMPFDIDALSRPERYKKLPGGSTPRVDIQAAISVIARRQIKRVADEKRKKYRLDLRGCNLQNVNFEAGNWQNAVFDGSFLDQGTLAHSNFEDASFAYCSFENTDFKGATLQGASAQGAKFRYIQISENAENVAVLENTDTMAATFDQCTFELMVIHNNFHATILKNSTFYWCRFTHAWFFDYSDFIDLESCRFVGCSMRDVRFKPNKKIETNIDNFFGDGSVHISSGKRPSFWPKHALSETQFHEEWRRWHKEGPDYTPPEAPEEG